MAVIEVIRSIPWAQPHHHRAPAFINKSRHSGATGHLETAAGSSCGVLIYQLTQLPIYQFLPGVSL